MKWLKEAIYLQFVPIANWKIVITKELLPKSDRNKTAMLVKELECKFPNMIQRNFSWPTKMKTSNQGASTTYSMSHMAITSTKAVSSWQLGLQGRKIYLSLITARRKLKNSVLRRPVENICGEVFAELCLKVRKTHKNSFSNSLSSIFASQNLSKYLVLLMRINNIVGFNLQLKKKMTET